MQKQKKPDIEDVVVVDAIKIAGKHIERGEFLSVGKEITIDEARRFIHANKALDVAGLTNEELEAFNPKPKKEGK